MTVALVDSTKFPQRSVGNGVTTVFPFQYKILAKTDIKVYVAGVLQTVDVNYSVTGFNTDAGGNVTFLTGAPANGASVIILRSMAQKRTTDYQQLGDFLSPVVNPDFDNAVLLIQDLAESDSRALHSSILDPLTSTIIDKTSFAGQFISVNGSGAIVPSSGTGNDTALRTDLANTTTAGKGNELVSIRKTQAETTGLVVPINYFRTPDVPVIDVRRYGAVLDGVIDDWLALKTALIVASIVGGRVLIPSNMAIASANSSAGTLFNLASNVEIVGLGEDTSKITVTGTTVTHLFKSTNQKNQRFADITITHNGASSAFNDGAILYWTQDTSATAVGGSFRAERCRFANCKSDYWLYFLNTGATFAAKDFYIERNNFVPSAGNSRDPTSVGAGSYCVAFQGATANSVGLIKNAYIEKNTADCNYVKGFGVSWHGTLNHVWSKNIIDNAGQTGANDDKAGYAIFCYDNSGGSGYKPDLIKFDSNIITSPRSCGIYIASGNRIFADGNVIAGQTDQVEATLPKAAIACNGATLFTARNNTLLENYGGIVLFGNTASDVLYAKDNTILSTVANSYGVRALTTFAGNSKRTEIVNNDIAVTGSASSSIGLRLKYTATAGVTTLIVKNNTRIEGTNICVFLDTGSSVPAITYAEFVNNAIAGNGVGYGLYWVGVTGGKTLIKDNRFIGTWASAGIMLNISTSTKLTVIDNEFNDMTSGTGFALETDGAQGRMEGNRFNNVSFARIVQATGSEDLGLDTPTWTGGANDFVQNLKPAEAGAAASKYVLYGWQWDDGSTAWRQQRALTGN